MQGRLRQHHVHTLVLINDLADVEIAGDAAQRIGVFLRKIRFLLNQNEHVPQCLLGGLIEDHIHQIQIEFRKAFMAEKFSDACRMQQGVANIVECAHGGHFFFLFVLEVKVLNV